MTLEELNNTIMAYDNIIKYYEEQMKDLSEEKSRLCLYTIQRYKKFKSLAVQELIHSDELFANEQKLIANDKNENQTKSLS